MSCVSSLFTELTVANLGHVTKFQVFRFSFFNHFSLVLLNFPILFATVSLLSSLASVAFECLLSSFTCHPLLVFFRVTSTCSLLLLPDSHSLQPHNFCCSPYVNPLPSFFLSLSLARAHVCHRYQGCYVEWKATMKWLHGVHRENSVVEFISRG